MLLSSVLTRILRFCRQSCIQHSLKHWLEVKLWAQTSLPVNNRTEAALLILQFKCNNLFPQAISFFSTVQVETKQMLGNEAQPARSDFVQTWAQPLEGGKKKYPQTDGIIKILLPSNYIVQSFQEGKTVNLSLYQSKTEEWFLNVTFEISLEGWNDV